MHRVKNSAAVVDIHPYLPSIDCRSHVSEVAPALPMPTHLHYTPFRFHGASCMPHDPPPTVRVSFAGFTRFLSSHTIAVVICPTLSSVLTDAKDCRSAATYPSFSMFFMVSAYRHHHSSYAYGARRRQRAAKSYCTASEFLLPVLLRSLLSSTRTCDLEVLDNYSHEQIIDDKRAASSLLSDKENEQK